MGVPYKNPDEQALNRSAIEQLAREVDKPISLVTRVYEAEYASLKRGAKVTNFLGVLATRRAGEALRRIH